MMTRDEQRIEAVAARIVATLIDGQGLRGEELAAEARRVNDGEGWSFDIRWTDQEYVSDDEWTRIGGCKLSDEHLTEAIQLAELWTDRLYGIAEIARVLGQRRQTVAMWHARGQLPEPDAKLAMGPVWRESTIRAYLDARKGEVER